MDIKSEYVLTIALLVSMKVFRRFCTDHLSGPDNTRTGGVAMAAAAFLFMVLIVKTNFSFNKGVSHFAIFETIIYYRIFQGNFHFVILEKSFGGP